MTNVIFKKKEKKEKKKKEKRKKRVSVFLNSNVIIYLIL